MPARKYPCQSRLNSAFSEAGPTAAALALARSDKDNLALDLRTLGVWNGEDGAGGMTYTTLYNAGRLPSDLDLREEGIPAFENYQNVAQIVLTVVEIWRPMLVKVTLWGYNEHQIFNDRPPWDG